MRAKPVSVVKQKYNYDCGVAALAMLLRKPYGDVSAVVRKLIPKFPRRGLGLYHLELLGKELGVDLKRVYKTKEYLIGRPTGILGVVGGNMSWAGHWVVIKEGVIIDPDDALIYGLKEYLDITKARPTTLLVIDYK